MSAADRLAALERQLLRQEAQRQGLNTEARHLREHYEQLRGDVLNPQTLRVVGSLGLDEVVRLLNSPECPPGDRELLEQNVDRRTLTATIAARDEMRRMQALADESSSELSALSTLVERCRQHIAQEAA